MNTSYLRMNRPHTAHQARPPVHTRHTAPVTQERFAISPTQTITLPMQSEGFDALPKLGRTLMALDVENLNYTMTATGFQPDYAALMTRLQPNTTSLQAHAFMTTGDHATEAQRRYFAAQNIAPHIQPVQHLMLAGGPKKCANSDNALLLRLGYLLAREEFDTVIIGTGDGLLGHSAVNFIAALPKPPRAYTLSVMGATANAIETHCNGLVNDNLYWGQDMLRSKHALGFTQGVVFH